MRADHTVGVHFQSRVPSSGAAALDRLERVGAVIDVTHRVPRKLFPVGRILIAEKIFERYVHWDSYASRTNGIWLDEDQRLIEIIEQAAAVKHHEMPAYFIATGVASDTGHGVSHRAGLMLNQVGPHTKRDWLITQA